ncbi:S16 family serine protease [Paenibacillus paridis]|uniref:S16 family serine protease n=1 Tax=Paenibacillus paridis TaxID=2583376 RepID=UPI0011215617|nr:S16 family serine protease [Paenibacillus paridis]
MLKQGSNFRSVVLYVMSTAVLMWVLLYAPTPYVAYEPGIAVPVKPMVAIEEGDELGAGDLLLTAVKLTEPNFLRAIQSVWNSNVELHLKKEVLRGYSKEQYAARLNVVMQGSQNNAIEAAYRYAGLPYETRMEGIIVSDVAAEDEGAFPTRGSFEAGDQILGINGDTDFGSGAEWLERLHGSSKDKPLSFEVVRGDKRLSIAYPAHTLAAAKTDEQLLAALGIKSLTEMRSIEPTDGHKRLTIAAGAIGGPSAGLVFALQSLDLLTEGDLSGGHRIAATGTITIEGNVGPIGGIKQKIVVASREGAELFLVPAGNFKEAKAKASSLGTNMKVVSVGTLQEALEQIEAFEAASV